MYSMYLMMNLFVFRMHTSAGSARTESDISLEHIDKAWPEDDIVLEGVGRDRFVVAKW